MLGVQVVLNVMIVTSLMPPTGISLPFVSWGGNSLPGIYGQHGRNAKHFKTFDKIMESEL